MLATHNNPTLHWQGRHGELYGSDISEKIKKSLDRRRDFQGSYIDLHRWRFYPSHFREVMKVLYDLEYIDFYLHAVHETQKNGIDFFVVLKKMLLVLFLLEHS